MAAEYLNNKVFEAIIERFRQAQSNKDTDRKEFETAEREISDAFYMLSKNIIEGFKFKLVDNDDALQEAVMICFEKLHRFDPKLGRAFNFCTTIILNHYRQLYRSAKTYNEAKIRYQDFFFDKNNNSYINSYMARQGRNAILRKIKQEMRVEE